MIVSILIIAYNPLLNTFGDDLKRQVNHPVYTPLRRQYGKFHRIQSKSCVRHISQKLKGIRFDLGVIASHSFFLIVYRPPDQHFDFLQRKWL